MGLQLSVIIAIVSFLYYYFTRTFNYWKVRNVKGPKPIPFFGNFKSVALRKQHMGMFYSDVYKQFPDEKVVGIYRMTSPALVIRDLDIVKQILVKDFEAFPDRGTYYSDEGLGQNIFHSDPDTWKILRSRLTSVFTPSKFKNTFHLLADRADKLADFIETIITKKTEQDVYQLVLRHTVGITMVSVFGLDVDVVNNTSRSFDIFDENLKTSLCNELDMLLPGALIKFNLSILPEVAIKFSHDIFKAGLSLLPRMKSELGTAMDVLLNMRKEGDIHIPKAVNTGNKTPFLKITDELLAAQVWILYVAGYVNNTLSLTYALYHLANNPEAQDKLIQEIDGVMEMHNGKFSYDVLNDMKYLGMVFEETLRMHPLTNALVRCANQNIKLDGTDLVIDKGMIVIISPYSIQHDEKYYPEPERFSPERFLPENTKGSHPCAFLSFGAGRRGCLGSRLGRIQFGVCLSKLLSRFRVETTKNTISNITYDANRLLLTPEQKIILKFVRRER